MFRRLLLIGLRLKGLQYNDAVHISENYYEGMGEKFIKRVIEYCGIDYQELIRFGDYKILQDLFVKFTKRHRNRLMHGVALTYTDEKMLELLISIDKRLILELEAFFAQKKKLSFFDPPKKWGAGKVKEKADIDKICKELFGKKLPPQPEYTMKNVPDIMKKLGKKEKGKAEKEK